MNRTWIKNAQIINEGQRFVGSVVIEDELIAEVLHEGEEPQYPCDKLIDAEGLYLIPGVIDEHVHFRDPGLTHKADMHSESIAAVAGGVTSFMDMPNTNPQTTTLEALEDKFNDAAQKSVANYSFYFGATNSNAHLLPELNKRTVCGVKLFMGASTGNMLVDRLDALKSIFQRSPILIATHCEDQTIIRRNMDEYRKRYGDDPDICLHPSIRNVEACYQSSALAVQLAREFNSRLHILHITTAKELQLFEDKPLNEKNITAEVTVSHLLFCDEDYTSLGARIKCNPSIKTKADRDALRKAVRTNLLDTIGTDHAPHLLSEKQGGAFMAVSGMPMIQFSLVNMLELAGQGVLTIEQVVEKMCHAPALLYQIEKRGFIRPNYKADLVLIHPNKPWTVSHENILSKCQWSPMEGHTFNAKVEKTFVNGHLAYDDGRVDTDYRGAMLTFDR